jgi:hypothetical protein
MDYVHVHPFNFMNDDNHFYRVETLDENGIANPACPVNSLSMTTIIRAI